MDDSKNQEKNVQQPTQETGVNKEYFDNIINTVSKLITMQEQFEAKFDKRFPEVKNVQEKTKYRY